MRSRQFVAPWVYSLGVVIGVPVEFALAALVCAFRRTGAAWPDQPAPGAVDDRHADVAVVRHLDGGGEPGCRWSLRPRPRPSLGRHQNVGPESLSAVQRGVRLHEKGGQATRPSVPYHRAAEVLDDYFEAAGLGEAPLFQSVGPGGAADEGETGAPDTPARPCGRGPAGEAERLHGAWNETGDKELVLPTVRGKALDAATILEAGQRLGIAAVPYGFRSRSETGGRARTDHPREVVEAAPAHVMDNWTEAAYARSDVPRRWARTVFPLRR